VMDVIATIRAGGEDGVIVRREAVAADFDVSDPSFVANYELIVSKVTRTNDPCSG
jgi:hypothetical protein